MLVSDDEKFVYVWIPHTGGTSMNSFLRNEFSGSIRVVEGTHSSPHDLDLDEYNDYTFFCIIRNHWDWLVSCWSYEQRINFLKDEKKRFLRKRMVFHDYLKSGISGLDDDTSRFWPEGFFNWGGENLKFIDHFIIMNYGRFIGFDNVMDKIGIDSTTYQFPHYNKNNSLSRDNVYSEVTKNMVYDYFEEEINFFGFEF